MTPERWAEVETLLNQVRERGVGVLSEAEPTVRIEVESLLEYASRRGALDHPAWLGVAFDDRLVLGSRLGPYEIEARLGAGGMGAVYRALDTRISRAVAIKHCDPQFIARFDREAEAISAFNHPHICTLYDVGPDYLVMELIQGETLSERIRRGPLPMKDVLRYGAQIADALGEAHSTGIVHCDLKPSNIMVAGRGIKVLDFGLAGMYGDPDAMVTESHAVFGTPAYMAPEQTKGDRLDSRTDLFALGLVLYEMTTGKLPFPGASLGNMLASDPTLTVPALPRTRRRTPPELSAIISTLLSADPSERTLTALQVRDELRTLRFRPSRTKRLLWIGASALFPAILVGAWWFTPRPELLQLADVMRLAEVPGNKLDPSYSLDGSMLAFSWAGEQGQSPGIYTMPASGESKPRRLTQSPGTDVSPEWSPDMKRIAFLRLRPGQPRELMWVSLDGTEHQVLSFRPADTTGSNALTWAHDGKNIVLGMADSEIPHGGLFQVNLSGSTIVRLVRGDKGNVDHPSISPDGRWLAYLTNYSLWIQPLDGKGMPSGNPTRVYDEAGFSPVWRPDSLQLLFLARSDRVMAWDARDRSVQTIHIMSSLVQSMTATWTASDGPRVVVSMPGGQLQERSVELSDATPPTAGVPHVLFEAGICATYSNNGRWVVFSRFSNGTFDIWLANADGSKARPITKLGAEVLRNLAWSPDDRQIAFHARFGRVAQPYVLDIDAAAEMAKPDDSNPGLKVRQVAKADFNLVMPLWDLGGKSLYVLSYEKRRMFRVSASAVEGELEELFENDGSHFSPKGDRIYYIKAGQTNLYTRSLDGYADSPEELLITDNHERGGFKVVDDGIFYRGIDKAGTPDSIRFYDFAQKRSTTIVRVPENRAFFSTLDVSPDRRHLLYDTNGDPQGFLLRLQLRERAGG